MGADQHQNWQALAASAMEWWVDAGVDTLVEDAPRDWLAKSAPALAVVAAPIAETPVAALPDTLEAFVVWRSGPDAPEAGSPGPRVVAEGDATASLMIVVDCPEGTGILEGTNGVLFDRMLAAIGHSRASVYLTTLAAARPLVGLIPPEFAARLAPLLTHHIGLAAPRQLLLMGKAASGAVLGADRAARRGSLHRVDLNGTTIDAVAIMPPEALLKQPRAKMEAWRGLQLLIGGKL